MKKYMAIIDGDKTNLFDYHGWKVGTKIKLEKDGPVLKVTAIDDENETVSFTKL